MHPLVFLLLLVLGTAFLVASMLLFGSTAGGVELGAVHVVTLKAAALVLVVDLAALLGVAGIFLAIPVWWAGLMLLFRIDFWECRNLVVINWIINAVLLLLASAFTA